MHLFPRVSQTANTFFHALPSEFSSAARPVRLIWFLLLLATVFPAEAYPDTGIVVDKLLTHLQQVLVRIDDATQIESLPPLSKVTLTLKSALKTEADGKLSFIVVEVGSQVSKNSIIELHFELNPPVLGDRSQVSSTSDRLADAIIQSIRAVQKAEEGKPPLHLDTLTASLRFVVESDTGASIRIKPLALQLGGAVETEHFHELTIKFKR